MAVEIGALRAMLSLDSAAFERGAKRAEASMGNLQRRFSRVGRNLRSFGTTMSTRVTAPMVAGLGLMARSAFNTAFEVERMADLSNAGLVEFQRFAAGAREVGIEQDKLSDILKDTNDRIGDFVATGGGPMADFFENIAPKVGVTAEQFQRLSGPEALQLYVSSLEEAGLSQQQMTFYMEALASDATALLPLLRDNGAEMDRLGDAAENAGALMNGTTVQALNNSREAMRAAGDAAKGLFNQLAASLAPVLETLAEKLQAAASWFSDLSPEMRRFGAIAATVVAAVGPLALGLGFVATAFAALASPIGLAIFAFGAVAGAAAYVITQWDEIEKKYPLLAKGMQRVGDVFKEVWTFVKDLVVGAADVVNGAIDGIVSLLTGDLKGALEGLKTMWQGWSDIVDSAMSAVLGIIEAIVPGFQQAVQDILDTVAALPGKLKQMGIDAIQGFVDGIRERWDAVKESVTSIFDFSGQNTGNIGRQLGRDLSDGMADGIQQGRGAAAAAARQAARDAEDAARDESDTRSPSRKWMEIGRDLMAGLGIGIQNNTQIATDAVRQGVNQMETGLEGLGEQANRTADKFGSMVAGLITGSKSIGNVLSRLGEQLLSSGISSFASAIAPSLFSGGGLFAGLFDGGGKIPGGQFGIVGERGPEIVTGPAQVTSRRDTAQMMQGGRAGGTATIRLVAPPGFTMEQRGEIQGIAVEVTEAGFESFERHRLPDQIERFNNDDKVRG